MFSNKTIQRSWHAENIHISIFLVLVVNQRTISQNSALGTDVKQEYPVAILYN
jgi:hypothetical protein